MFDDVTWLVMKVAEFLFSRTNLSKRPLLSVDWVALLLKVLRTNSTGVSKIVERRDFSSSRRRSSYITLLTVYEGWEAAKFANPSSSR